MDKEEKDRKIQTHEDLVIYQKAFEAAMIIDYQDPWLIVTDLDPEVGNVLWSRFRSWIESSYRDVKSDGWQWQKTRLRDPARAERIWLAMAVATLWTITMGSEQPEELSSKAQEMDIDPGFQ